MKAIFAILLIAFATGLSAKTLSFPTFRIDVPDSWDQHIKTGPADQPAGGVQFHYSDDLGSLKIQSLEAPEVVSEARLRNLTNLDAATTLTWQHWGDFSGYQYDYEERGAFFRQWWLVNGQIVVFITYQTDPDSKDIATADIDRVVRSLSAGASQPR
jgi:hypothetical protein